MEENTPHNTAPENTPATSPAPAPAATPTETPEVPANPAPVQNSPKKPSSVPAITPESVPQDERMMAAAGYIPMLFMFPLIMKSQSEFCKWHGKQGLITSGLVFITLFATALIPLLGLPLFLVTLALTGVSAFKAYEGQFLPIPILSDLSKKIDINALFATPPHKPTTPPATSAPAATETPPAPPAEPKPNQESKQP